MARSLLVTGFGPFGGEKINPSEILIRELQDRDGLEVQLLPVEYDGAFRKLERALNENNHRCLLMLGQAGGRSKINLERVALNFQDSSSADEMGIKRLEQKIRHGGAEALFTGLPLRKIREEMVAAGHEVVTSISAGSFVCNVTYYKALEWLAQNPNRLDHALFVHVPYLPEQLEGKPQGTPSMSLEQMRAALETLMVILSR